MKKIVAIYLYLFLETANAGTTQVLGTPGLLRGLDDVATYLDGRIYLNPSAQNEIKTCLSNDYSLLNMLKVTPGNRDGAAAPNPLNTNVWLAAMTCMSRRITPGICENFAGAPKVKSKLASLFAPLCKPPQPGVKPEENIQAIWDQTVGFDADGQAKLAFSAKAMNLVNHPKAAELILTMLLMNPYVLLNP